MTGATATVTYHFERSPEDKVTTPMVFTRDGEGLEGLFARTRLAVGHSRA